jgi:hypothetical protein
VEKFGGSAGNGRTFGIQIPVETGYLSQQGDGRRQIGAGLRDRQPVLSHGPIKK